MTPLPNFLIIGAAKAGTTSLYQYLQQHPQVFLSTPKEPRFFALEGQTLDYQGPIQVINRTSITQWDEYLALFAEAGDRKAVGEASTLYLYEPSTADRIQRYLGNPKIIAVLRNPISRAYSNYLHLVRDGQETLSFEAALQTEEERIQNNWPPLWHYQQRGFYFQQLQPYLGSFSRDHIKVLLFEDLANASQSVMRDLFDFLEVDTQFQPDMSMRANLSGVPKSKWLSGLLNRQNPLKKFAKMILPQGFRKNVYATLQKGNTGDKTQINPLVKQRLIEVYRQDVEQLQQLLDRDLSHWLV